MPEFRDTILYEVPGLVAGSSGAGNANHAALQNALDDAGVIDVRTPGIYFLNQSAVAISNTLIRCGPGVEFRASPGTNAPLLINAGAVALGTTGITPGSYAGDTNIHVQGGIWNGDSANQTVAYSTVQMVKLLSGSFTGATFKGGLRTGTFPTVSSHGDGLALTYCTDVFVDRCMASDNVYDGFKIRGGGQGCTFSNLIARNNGRCGLQISYVDDKTHPAAEVTVNGIQVYHDTGTPTAASPTTHGVYMHVGSQCNIHGVKVYGTRGGVGVYQGSTDNVFTSLLLQTRYDATGTKAVIDIEGGSGGDEACVRNQFVGFHLRPISGATGKLIRVQAGVNAMKNNYNQFRSGYGSAGAGTGTWTVEIETGCLQTKFSDIHWAAYTLTNNGTNTTESNVTTG